MNWLARLKKIDTAAERDATETTKRVSVVFVAPGMAPMTKTGGDSAAANDPAPDPDRWAWPHSAAMTGAEIDTFTARLARFTNKGLSLEGAEGLADRLVTRDRESDDRRLCLECVHLARNGLCKAVSTGGKPIEPVPTILQRCDSFATQL